MLGCNVIESTSNLAINYEEIMFNVLTIFLTAKYA